MVVGFGAGVVPSTTSNATGALLWVFGARGDIGAVTPVGHLKGFKYLYKLVWGSAVCGEYTPAREKSVLSHACARPCGVRSYSR